MQRFRSRTKSAGTNYDQAWSLFDAGRYNDAEREFRKVVAAREGKLGLKDIYTLDSKSGLAESLYKQGKNDEAEKCFREIISVYEVKLGLEHNDTLDSKRGLGWSLHSQGKSDEAEKYFREVIPVFEAKLGLAHISTLNSKHGLAWSLHSQGKDGEAEKYFKEIMPAYGAKQGYAHIFTLDSKNGLGWSLHSQGKSGEAEKYFREIMPVYEAQRGPGHIYTLISKRGLALTLYEQGKSEEAERYFREAGIEMPAGSVPQHPGNIFTFEGSSSLPKSIPRQRQLTNPAEDQTNSQIKSVLQEPEDSVGKHYNCPLTPTIESSSPKSYAESPIPGSERISQGEATMSRASMVREHEKLSNGSRGTDVLNSRRLSLRSPFQQEDQGSKDAISLHGHADDTKIHHDNERLPGRRDSKTLSDASVGDDSDQLTDHLDMLLRRNVNETILYTDSEISKIALLLQHTDPQWSKYPRTYIVLRWMNCIHLFDSLIALGFSDCSFPATEKTLPQLLSPNQKSEFVKVQRMILTRSLDLEKGKHCYFDKGESLPLQKQRILGRGAFGLVDEVLSTISYVTYARKRVIRRSSPELVQLFVAEIMMMKRLKHKHTVELVGSYTDIKYLGLLMLPVAEMNLSTYLTRPDRVKCLGELRTFFGCLATALEFLHSQRICHNDIKPENILIHRGNVLLTDIGLSYDFSDGQNTKTVGMVDALTFEYCAPEVVEHEPRNPSSDIWGLGVVFLEMLVVIKGQTRGYMNEYFAKHGSGRPYVRSNPNGTAEVIATLRMIGYESDNQALAWIEAMLRKQVDRRITAAQLVTVINTSHGLEGGQGRFCGLCCAPTDDFSDFSD